MLIYTFEAKYIWQTQILFPMYLTATNGNLYSNSKTGSKGKQTTGLHQIFVNTTLVLVNFRY